MKPDVIAQRGLYAPVAHRPPELVENHLRWRRRFDRIAEKVILGFAAVAIAIIFLIFIYVAREALPLVTQSVEGISLSTPFTAPFTWQPVSTSPKYNVI